MTQEEYLQLVNEVNSNKKFTQINYPLQGRKVLFYKGEDNEMVKLFKAISTHTSPELEKIISNSELDFSGIGFGGFINQVEVDGRELLLIATFDFGDLPEDITTAQEVLNYIVENKIKLNPVFHEEMLGNITEEQFINLSNKEGIILPPSQYENRLQIEFDTYNGESVMKDYYAWGEISPKEEYTIQNYVGPVNGATSDFIEDEDDVIYINDQKKYFRIMEYEQAEQLVNHPYYNWTVVNGQLGALFSTEPTREVSTKQQYLFRDVFTKQQYLFIPAQQCSKGKNGYPYDRYCLVWLKYTDKEDNSKANALYCDKDGVQIVSESKYVGCSVIGTSHDEK